MVIAIVGGGASGLMAAIAASKSPDCQVHILGGRAGLGASCWPPATAGAT